MIAGVNGWHAVLSALLVFLPQDARAADDLGGAIRELARKTAAFAGRGEPVSLSWRNVSSLGSAEFNQARAAFESALRESGGRASDIAPVAEARFINFGKSDADSDCGRGAQGRRPSNT